MPEDASLDAFDSEESADAESADSASADTSRTVEVDPAVSTFDWSPEGGECAECGKSEERRWRADGERGGELVCAECKDW